MLKLDSQTHVIQQNLLAHVHKHLSVKTRAMNAEVTKREEKWGQERDFLQGQIAKLEAENARLKGDGALRRGKCSQCIKHRETIAGLQKGLQQCQEDSQEQQDRLEEQVSRKKTKLKGYVQLLYAKDDEIEELEMKCQQRESEISELEDKYLFSIKAELDKRRAELDRNIAEYSLSVSECLNSDGLAEEQKQSNVTCHGDEQSDDEKFLSLMEVELD